MPARAKSPTKRKVTKKSPTKKKVTKKSPGRPKKTTTKKSPTKRKGRLVKDSKVTKKVMTKAKNSKRKVTKSPRGITDEQKKYVYNRILEELSHRSISEKDKKCIQDSINFVTGLDISEQQMDSHLQRVINSLNAGGDMCEVYEILRSQLS